MGLKPPRRVTINLWKSKNCWCQRGRGLNIWSFIPLGSMYGIITYIYHHLNIYHKNQLNVGEYTIHWSYGIVKRHCLSPKKTSFALFFVKFQVLTKWLPEEISRSLTFSFWKVLFKKWVDNMWVPCVYMGDYTHRIHAWYIYLHLP